MLTTATATTGPLPAGAQVGFYQTLPGSAEVPYLIEQRSIDPFNLVFAFDQTLSGATTIDFGTFSSSGSTIALSTFTPQEGGSVYRVGASAPLYTDAVLTTAPTVGQSASTVFVPLPPMLSASGATSTVGISVSTPNSRFNQGQIILSHDGTIVATAALDSVLQSNGGTLTIPGLPSGSGFAGITTSALYYVSVRVWNSSNPTNTLTREFYPTPLDLSAGGTTYSLTIN